MCTKHALVNGEAKYVRLFIRIKHQGRQLGNLIQVVLPSMLYPPAKLQKNLQTNKTKFKK